MSKLHNENLFNKDHHRRQAALYFRQISRECIHYLSIDCVVFGFHENQLKVLLLRWKGTDRWSLPGGFIRTNESLDDAAQRCLQERTGLETIFLRHFGNFGDINRYDQEKTWKKINLELPRIKWPDRTISIGYFALVEYSKVRPAPDFLSDECSWVNVSAHPPLLFDHDDIVGLALESLRQQLPYLPINHLLPRTFTMPEFQRLYETILGRSLDTRNFQRKILGSRILRKLDKKVEGTPHKSPFLFTFEPREYARAVKDGRLAFL